MVKTGVIHGRFQPLHNDHMRYILAGKDRCEHLIVGVTNPDPSLTAEDEADPERSSASANPLTYYERYVILNEALLEAGINYRQFSVVPLPINNPELYKYYVPLDAVFFMTIYDGWGRRKRDLFNSQGLRTDVMWERPIDEKGLTGKEIRSRMMEGKPWEDLVPRSAAVLLAEWGIPRRLVQMQEARRAR
jgi:nicotinamide mononucleotide adenylyltransferase